MARQQCSALAAAQEVAVQDKSRGSGGVVHYKDAATAVTLNTTSPRRQKDGFTQLSSPSFSLPASPPASPPPSSAAIMADAAVSPPLEQASSTAPSSRSRSPLTLDLSSLPPLVQPSPPTNTLLITVRARLQRFARAC